VTYFRHQGLATRWLAGRYSVIISRPTADLGGMCMSLQDRIGELKEQHAALERAIDEENARPLPNDDAISDLKRQKLRIKDEIFQLESQ
jgi:hypothetical protein